MSSDRKIKKIILQNKVSTDLETQNRILSKAYDELDKRVDTNSHNSVLYFIQTILRNRFAQLTFVTCLLAAILLIAEYTGNPVAVCDLAIAQVARNIDNVDAFTYRYRHQSLNGIPYQEDASETVLYISPEKGIRLGTYIDGKTEKRAFLLPAEKVLITVMPEQKQYARKNLDEISMQNVINEKDPRQLIRQFLLSDYIDLGCSEVSGVQARGIQVSDPTFLVNSLEDIVGRLWVNTKTQLPVRMEIEGNDPSTSKRIMIITDEFRWQPAFQDDDLTPFIPEDYILSPENEGN